MGTELMATNFATFNPRDLLQLIRFMWRARINPLTTTKPEALISVDGPRPYELRSIVNRGFTPRRISAWGVRVREVVDECMAKTDTSARSMSSETSRFRCRPRSSPRCSGSGSSVSMTSSAGPMRLSRSHRAPCRSSAVRGRNPLRPGPAPRLTRDPLPDPKAPNVPPIAPFSFKARPAVSPERCRLPRVMATSIACKASSSSITVPYPEMM